MAKKNWQNTQNKIFSAAILVSLLVGYELLLFIENILVVLIG